LEETRTKWYRSAGKSRLFPAKRSYQGWSICNGTTIGTSTRGIYVAKHELLKIKSGWWLQAMANSNILSTWDQHPKKNIKQR